jgi:hypothetical protein
MNTTKPKSSPLLIFLLFVSLSLFSIEGDPYNSIAGFNTKTLSTEAESFKVSLVIFSGSNFTYAGEFNVSYNPNYINLTKIEAGNNWIIVPVGTPSRKYVFYRNPSAASLPDRTVLATLTFKRKAVSETVKLNVSLTLFKAADGSGNDLNIHLANSTVTITLVVPEETGGGGGGGGGGPAGILPTVFTWLIVGSVALASIIILSALYLRTSMATGYFLVGDGFSIPVRDRERVFGREDFYAFVSADKLSYITRRGKGGQFQIVRFRDGYYIRDDYSTNETFVNGVGIKGRGYVPLRNGDRISIPNVLEMRFIVGRK